MKKFGAALAICVPFACAYAQSSVTIYGVVDAAVTFGNDGVSSVRRLDSGVGPGSRLGFRGVEDLGGGLAAQFTMEMGLDSGTGGLQQGGLAFGRQMFVGLGSKEWTLTAGRQYSPTELSMVATDAMGQNYWGSSSGYGIGTLQSPASAALTGSGCQGATVRINNSVMGTYAANGFTGRLLAGAGEENAQRTGRVLSAGLAYAGGPFMVSAAYLRMRQCAPDLIAGSTGSDWQPEWTVGGTFDFKVAKLFAGYYRWNPSERNRTITATTMRDHDAVWLGVRVPVSSAGVVIAQVARLSDDLAAAKARGTSIGITYEHSMSKRTRLYVSAGRISNNDQARFGLAAATAAQGAGAAGADPRALSFGISQLF